ncbi:tyrosine-type recombinase/integrase [Paeniglutamicibacter gangotriensis]|uniref:Integrase family protein n=1 Tax=Paeniglutamicibacter gangotriensis Lz1y TaxID=1276920 RepID=M7MU84_9MICC|nr:tyrosine-type recombinase/integrase [Paeniglutamicibacter gangotriensis]EMQ99992.1 integrase family protein [Paeniglutamicibacter gangotriensis Lz1y]
MAADRTMSSTGLDIALMVDQYLRMRRGMGYTLHGQGQRLLDFARFFQNTGAEHVSTAIILDWATLPSNADRTWWYARLGAVRPFAQFLQAFDAQTQVPEASAIKDGDHRVRPFIFSEAELARLLAAADKIQPAFRALTYRTYISLVAVTGMRRSETTNLDRSDFDWENGALTIREAKFHKTRRLPLHPSTITALDDYAHQRDREFGTTEQPAFFLSSRGTRLSSSSVGQVFAGLVQVSGLPRLETRHQQSLHDLRHTFAVRTLQGWYQSGADVGPLLPLLSTYLGHQNPDATYWYLSGTPELMTLVSERVRTYLQEES